MCQSRDMKWPNPKSKWILNKWEISLLKGLCFMYSTRDHRTPASTSKFTTTKKKVVSSKTTLLVTQKRVSFRRDRSFAPQCVLMHYMTEIIFLTWYNPISRWRLRTDIYSTKTKRKWTWCCYLSRQHWWQDIERICGFYALIRFMNSSASVIKTYENYSRNST